MELGDEGTKAQRFLLPVGGHRPPLQPNLGLRVAGELAGGSIAGKTFPASGPAAIDDRAAVLRGHAGQKAELADTTLLGGLERSFHGKYLG
jgi:hypothetical protein